MTIGERMRKRRENLGLTQVSVADKAGISKQTLYKYENDIVTNIPLPTISKIAEVLNVSESYLMGWEDEEIIIETVQTDIALTNMQKRVKEYALKLSALPKEKQEQIMRLIDMLEK